MTAKKVSLLGLFVAAIIGSLVGQTVVSNIMAQSVTPASPIYTPIGEGVGVALVEHDASVPWTEIRVLAKGFFYYRWPETTGWAPAENKTGDIYVRGYKIGVDPNTCVEWQMFDGQPAAALSRGKTCGGTLLVGGIYRFEFAAISAPPTQTPIPPMTATGTPAPPVTPGVTPVPTWTPTPARTPTPTPTAGPRPTVPPDVTWWQAAVLKAVQNGTLDIYLTTNAAPRIVSDPGRVLVVVDLGDEADKARLLDFLSEEMGKSGNWQVYVGQGVTP